MAWASSTSGCRSWARCRPGSSLGPPLLPRRRRIGRLRGWPRRTWRRMPRVRSGPLPGQDLLQSTSGDDERKFRPRARPPMASRRRSANVARRGTDRLRAPRRLELWITVPRCRTANFCRSASSPRTSRHPWGRAGPACGRRRRNHRRRSGRAGGRMMRAGPATRRRAWPGCGRAGARAMPRIESGAWRHRSCRVGGSTPKVGCRKRSPGGRTVRQTGSAGRATGRSRTASAAGSGSIEWAARIRTARRTAPSRASNPSSLPRPAAVPPWACPTGSAGWSSAPASTASRATSASTRAGCS